MTRTKFRFFLFAVLALLGAASPLGAFGATEVPPIATAFPSDTRQAIVRTAESFLGVPYRLGGEDKKGLDCSGLIFLTFKNATGRSVPRTVTELAHWVLVIPENSLQPGDLVFFDLQASSGGQTKAKAGKTPSSSVLAKADHVGIYSGDGNFIHAASSGSKRGVTINSLSETNWSRRFLFAGRAVAASAFSGVAVDWGVGAMLEGAESLSPELRGASLWVGASIPMGRNFGIGLQTRAAWDSYLDVVRIPVELVVGQTSGLSVFAGPAFTIGTPTMPSSAAMPAPRIYEPVNAWIASAGLRWSPLLLGSGSRRGGIYAELRFERYVPIGGQGDNAAADRRAVITLGLGLRMRSMHY